jgi:hypothetical protein
MDIKNLVIVLLIIFLFAIGNAAKEKVDSLNEKLKASHEIIGQLQAEKELSDKATTTATTIREQIHEKAREQLKEIDQALQDNGSFADIIIPDNIRERLFNKKNDGASVLPAPGNTPR